MKVAFLVSHDVGRPLRFIPPECPLVEVTTRTIQGRFLLRPSPALNKLALGVLARAARLHQMKICAFIFLSNHYHLLLRPRNAEHLSRFMNYLNGNLAREAGRLHRWREKFWSRPYRAIPVSYEPEIQVERLKYILEQRCKEGLVSRPKEWPGASCVSALCGDEPIVGLWYDRTAAYRLGRWGGGVVKLDDFAEQERLELAALPCWQGLRVEDIQGRVQELLDEIVEETAQRQRATGRRPLGSRAILAQHPHSRPQRVKRSPAPRFHAASYGIRKMLEAMYWTYLDLRAEAIETIRAGRFPIRYPEHGIPPPLIPALSQI